MRPDDCQHAAVAREGARIGCAFPWVCEVRRRSRLVTYLQTDSIRPGLPVVLGQNELERLRDLHTVFLDLTLQGGGRGDQELRATRAAVGDRRAAAARDRARRRRRGFL